MDIITLKLSVTNCFLIKTRHKYILIDTGYEEDWDLFCNRLKDANVNLSDISHIILTHHHDDHSGLLNKIIDENKNIKIVMSYLAKDLLVKGINDQSHGGGLINKRIKLLMLLKKMYIGLILRKVINKENLTFPAYKSRENDILIKGETKLESIGIYLKGKIIETPGHSIDSISILFDDGDCIVGDAAANFLQFVGTKYCVVYICNLNEYYRSWEKIILENARRIFPAHGKQFDVKKLKDNLWKNKSKNMVLNNSKHLDDNLN
ncbi:MBL fold metallo-hydrolase [uncultured Clostridium sp.]|uniref:MBL fold metallo-hydrolase n=1 Tax=uncultured Clostridium sp. TaxID=59620 RepID=UPI0028EFFE9C|nr:MBL fold metallo-hydrolase [uncultured Clostridium sp.]